SSIAFRWAEGRYERLPALAAELVDLHVALLLAAGGTNSISAAKAATSTIPIVFSGTSDPVRYGFVPSLSRPAATKSLPLSSPRSLRCWRSDWRDSQDTPSRCGFRHLGEVAREWDRSACRRILR